MRRRAIRRGAAWMAAILLLALLPYQTMTGSSSDTVPAQKPVKEAAMEAKSVIGRVSVDENGFDAKGRIVAAFGTPVIDGRIDPVWDKAQPFRARHRSGNTEASATFRAMWDDRAIYILAEVKDSHLSVQSGTPYMQDSLEIFLDENRDKTREYGADDLQFRVNAENVQSVDKGDGSRFYTAVSKTEDGYVVEARVALLKQPANGTVMGIELQINDAVGEERVGTLNVFDATGMAWDDTGLFGEVVLTGKKPGDRSGPNPYDLLNLI